MSLVKGLCFIGGRVLSETYFAGGFPGKCVLWEENTRGFVFKNLFRAPMLLFIIRKCEYD